MEALHFFPPKPHCSKWPISSLFCRILELAIDALSLRAWMDGMRRISVDSPNWPFRRVPRSCTIQQFAPRVRVEILLNNKYFKSITNFKLIQLIFWKLNVYIVRCLLPRDKCLSATISFSSKLCSWSDDISIIWLIIGSFYKNFI